MAVRRHPFLLAALAAIALSSATPASAQSFINSGDQVTIAAAAAPTCVIIRTQRLGGASITLGGTFTGLTAAFEVNNRDSSTVATCAAGNGWVAKTFPTSIGGTAVSSATATGTWDGSISGYLLLRVRVSALSTGSVTVTLATGQGGGTGGGGGGGGGSFDGVLKTPNGDSAMDETNDAARVNIVAGSSSGKTDDDDASIAAAQTAVPMALAMAQAFDGTVWRRVTFGTAGTASAQVTTVQGIASMTPLLVTASATNLDVQIGGSDTLTVASHAVTNAGTFATQVDGAALTALQLIDNLPNTIGSTTSGQSGALAFGATTTAAPTYTTAQSNPLSLQTDGSVRAAVTNTVTVAAHAVTNAGTFATQVDGAALTALQLIDNLPNTQGSTTSGQSGLLGMGAVTTAAPTYTTAQTSPLSLQTDGSVRTAVTNTVTVASHAVTNAGTFATQADTELPAAGALSDTLSNPTTPMIGAASLTWNSTNSQWQRLQVPQSACDDPAKVTSVNIALTAGTGNTELVALTASQTIFVCGYNIQAGAANLVVFSYGTGTACATGNTDLETFEAFAAGEGAAVSNGGAVQFKTAVSNALCVERTSSTTLRGRVTYVKQVP